MRARPALLDLYGDHLRSRGGRAPVAALVRLLAPVGVAAPAVRTAVSRMVRQGWLHPVRLRSGPGYRLTPQAARHLDDAAARLHRGPRAAWDGRFDLLVLHGPLPAADRRRLAELGYGPVAGHTWLAPRPAGAAAAVLDAAGTRYDRFAAVPAADAAALAGRAWDLPGLARGYERFVAERRRELAAVPARGDDEAAYAARFGLLHAWRRTAAVDPQLPAALLPAGWPGARAAAFVDRHAARLLPAADRFVERCLAGPQRPPPAEESRA